MAIGIGQAGAHLLEHVRAPTEQAEHCALLCVFVRQCQTNTAGCTCDENSLSHGF